MVAVVNNWRDLSLDSIANLENGKVQSSYLYKQMNEYSDPATAKNEPRHHDAPLFIAAVTETRSGFQTRGKLASRAQYQNSFPATICLSFPPFLASGFLSFRPVSYQ